MALRMTGEPGRERRHVFFRGAVPALLAQLVFGAAVLLQLQPPATAHAQSPSAAATQLKVSPAIAELELDPGATETLVVTLSAGSEPLTVEFEHADVGFQPDTYQPVLIEDDAEQTVATSTRGWFTVPRRRATIPRAGSIDVPVRIEVPENVAPGTHVGAALFRTVAAPRLGEASGTRIQASARTGPIVFIAIEGGSEPRPRLERFDVPALVGKGPIDVEVEVANEGSTHLVATLELQLDEGEGGDSTVRVEDRYVLPGEPRSIRPVDDGELKLGGQDLRPGRHKVRLSLQVQPGSRRITDTQVVWVVPWWLWLIVLVSAAALAGAVALALMRWRQQRDLLAAHAMAEGPDDEHDDDERPDDEHDDDQRPEHEQGAEPEPAADSSPELGEADEPEDVEDDDVVDERG